MATRGRPKKNPDDLLQDRVGTRVRGRVKKELEYIYDVEGIAVETQVRVAINFWLRHRKAQEQKADQRIFAS